MYGGGGTNSIQSSCIMIHVQVYPRFPVPDLIFLCNNAAKDNELCEEYELIRHYMHALTLCEKCTGGGASGAPR